MKKMLKTATITGAIIASAIGGGIYLMNNKKMRKKASQVLLKTMDDVEASIANKMN